MDYKVDFMFKIFYVVISIIFVQIRKSYQQ